MNRRGIVYYNNILCGEIVETDGSYLFSYYQEYLKREDAKAVSLTLPLTSETYESNILFPFFDGIIPEGWLLEIAHRKWKVDINDRMGLLLSVCEDTIGAVSVKGVK